MNNLQKWQSLTSNLMSPQTCIDFVWYGTVGIFLNRKVWMGDFDCALFPNLYIVNVGLAGIGKTLGVVRGRKLILSIDDLEARPVVGKNGIRYQPKLIKTAADSTNFSALMEEMSKATRAGKRPHNNKMLPYPFTPFAIVEDELSALFREKEGSQISKAMLKLYDCENYEYYTRMHGMETVFNPCVSMLASTTPSFLQWAHDTGIFSDGFSSRTIWIFEGRSRFETPRIDTLTAEQLELQEQLKKRLRKIYSIVGQVIEPPAVRTFVDKYFFDNLVPAKELSGGFMRDYFSRKMTHIHKLAMCIHFSDSDELTLTIDDYTRAIELIDDIEPKMRMGLSMLGRNPLANLSNSVYDFIRAHKLKGCTLPELLAQFIHDITQKELSEILDVLRALDRISYSEQKYKAKM